MGLGMSPAGPRLLQCGYRSGLEQSDVTPPIWLTGSMAAVSEQNLPLSFIWVPSAGTFPALRPCRGKSRGRAIDEMLPSQVVNPDALEGSADGRRVPLIRRPVHPPKGATGLRLWRANLVLR